MEYSPATRKNKILAFATTWMDPESIILSEVRQRKIWSHLYVDSRGKHTHTHTSELRTDSWLPEVGNVGGAEWVKVVKRYKLLIIKEVGSGDVMHSMEGKMVSTHATSPEGSGRLCSPSSPLMTYLNTFFLAIPLKPPWNCTFLYSIILFVKNFPVYPWMYKNDFPAVMLMPVIGAPTMCW